MSRVLLFDYGVGNLHSLEKALARRGDRVTVSRSAETIAHADAIVLPGVGAFGAAAAALLPERERIRDAVGGDLPCLGICLGMQLLFESSDEGNGAGLGLVPGHVHRLRTARVPHMGWNDVVARSDPLFDGIETMVAYYANSFVAECRDEDSVLAWTCCDDVRFPAAVRSGSAVGVQFHPEKSAADGLRCIDNFLESLA
jgi:imidazole glycerol-phosphate synthase subunit HisH